MKLKITIDQKTYEVDVEAVEPESQAPPRGYVMEPAGVRVPAAAAPTPARSSDVTPVNEEKVCRSPVSGTIVKVLAQAGQNLQAGDVMIVLEAMKMETNITAPAPGKVTAVKVSLGDNVQAGQVVVEMNRDGI